MLGGSVSGRDPFDAPIFATPLPPGPGSVPLSIPAQPFAAPVLMPLGAPTAAPVGVYQYPTPVIATESQGVATATGEGVSTPYTGGFYGSADFLYAAGRGVYVPPLVTLSPNGTAPASARALYLPTTIPQFGGVQLGQAFRPGFRFNVGYWFGPDRRHAIDGSFFFLGTLSESFDGATAPGGVILARPAVNGLTGENFALPFGPVGPATIAAAFGTSVTGGDLNYRRGLKPDGQLDLIAGFRYLNLTDDLSVYASQGAMLPVPTTIAQTVDTFGVRNNFYGPQVGLASHCKLAAGFSLDLLTKLAMGVTVAEASLTGASRTTFGSPPGGLLVGPANAGTHTTSSFAVVPEVGIKLGYDVTANLRTTFGYSLVYWSRVERAPNQVDLTVLAPGRPGFPNRGTDFWVQGWTAGLAWKY